MLWQAPIHDPPPPPSFSSSSSSTPTPTPDLQQVHCDRMLDAGVLDTTLDIIYNPEYKYPDEPCMLLANLTRAESVASRLLNKRKSDDKSHLLRLIDIFVLERNYNKHGQYHHLGSVIFNSTRLAEARDSITLRIGEGRSGSEFGPDVSLNQASPQYQKKTTLSVSLSRSLS